MTRRPFNTIPLLIAFLLINFNICLAQHKSPLEVVKLFDKAYGGPLMHEIADYTTPGFRDNKPKSVWVVDTWKSLNKLKYKRLNSSIISSKVKDDEAIVIMESKIKTAAGEAIQKEVYYLVKEGKRWLIDELVVADEEIDQDIPPPCCLPTPFLSPLICRSIQGSQNS